MATKQYIQERIAKAEEKIAKKQGTIVKKEKMIEKKASALCKKYGFQDWKQVDKYCRLEQNKEEHHEIYWTICDLESYESDIIRLNKEIQEAQTSLQKYQTELQTIIEKENSRNVKVILDFLESWKQDCIEFFLKERIRYEEACVRTKNEIQAIQNEKEELPYQASWNKKHPEHEKYEELDKKQDKIRRRHQAEWMHVTQFNHGSADWETTMRNDLEQEKFRKYDDIIERTNAIVGEITDASYLTCNEKGNLDGIIKGTRGNAKVQTIGAGGYNIQCFHFRTLIHAL